ncbi:MAG: hypothetical protein ACKOEX_05470 [Planctomycetia bacterium]
MNPFQVRSHVDRAIVRDRFDDHTTTPEPVSFGQFGQKNFGISLDSFWRHCPQLSHHGARSRREALQNVVRPLHRAPRGSVVGEFRVLVVRSHFHGEEEEEGCQEGRQEEEGPRLVLLPTV